MNRVRQDEARAGERGAVSIKTIFIMLVAASVVFAVIKIVPVYVEQNKLLYDIDELANAAAMRDYKEEKINRDIERIRGEYDLPKGSINMVAGADKKVEITVQYTRSIDLLVTTYEWQVQHKARGKEL